jgi:hypothetical protein
VVVDFPAPRCCRLAVLAKYVLKVLISALVGRHPCRRSKSATLWHGRSEPRDVPQSPGHLADPLLRGRDGLVALPDGGRGVPRPG